jgi:hypothetical protein
MPQLLADIQLLPLDGRCVQPLLIVTPHLFWGKLLHLTLACWDGGCLVERTAVSSLYLPLRVGWVTVYATLPH